MTDTRVPAEARVTDARVRRVELVISAVLRTGVAASLAVIVAGLALALVDYPAERSSSTVERHMLSPQAGYPHSVGTVFAGIAHGDAVSIIALGLVMLVATPVARVAVSVLAFVYERDPVFVAVTSFVLAVLIGSFALGTAGG